MLKESEWKMINNILAELYTVDNESEFFEKLLKILHMMIPYTMGYVILLDEDKQIVEDRTYFVGMDDIAASEYVDRYYKEDYLWFLYEIKEETTVYRDTDILDEEVRRGTVFYREFLEPLGVPYGLGILIIHSGRKLGIINLFRGEEYGDFSDKDMYILNILKRHMENIFLRLTCIGGNSDAHLWEQLGSGYRLTERELEIVRLISRGMSNNELCDRLVISLSTVKKHIYNIYLKTGVKSRTQLMNLVFNAPEEDQLMQFRAAR